MDFSSTSCPYCATLIKYKNRFKLNWLILNSCPTWLTSTPLVSSSPSPSSSCPTTRSARHSSTRQGRRTQGYPKRQTQTQGYPKRQRQTQTQTQGYE